MAQITLMLPDDMARRLRDAARESGLSVSEFVWAAFLYVTSPIGRDGFQQLVRGATEPRPE
jgi:uncharacterized membrane protein YhaH (DUF805 family)